MLGVALMIVPLVSASEIPFGNSLIKTDSEFSGNAVMNETIDLKLSTGMDTYEWKQSSVYNNLSGQKIQSVLNIRQENGSMSWSFQRTGYSIPFQASTNQYVDDHTIIKPQYRFTYPAIPLMPGIQLI